MWRPAPEAPDHTGPEEYAIHVFGKTPVKVKSFGLYILRQTQGDCAGFCRGSQYSHGLGKSSQQLLRALHPVPIPRDRLETVVYRNVLSERRLQLLQHRSDVASGEKISGKQQYWKAVYRRQSGTGHHVGGSGTNGTGAHHGPHAEGCLGKCHGRVHHRLLVAKQVIRQPGSCSRACPIPATFPCPKIPKQPSKKRCCLPSRSTY